VSRLAQTKRNLRKRSEEHLRRAVLSEIGRDQPSTVQPYKPKGGKLWDALFVPVYRRVPSDLSALGGRQDGNVEEGVVQEVDIKTGRVLFEWHSLPHVAADESYEPVPKDESEPFDYFHLNAIEEDGDGAILISARHTHAIYKIRKRDGALLWRLGGKRSSFHVASNASFAWQHDPRLHADGTLKALSIKYFGKDYATKAGQFDLASIDQTVK
jgi:hypothetical protein